MDEREVEPIHHQHHAVQHSAKASAKTVQQLWELGVVVVIGLIAGGYYLLVPHRSVQAFCNTFQQQSTSLHNKYDAEDQAIASESQSDPLAGMFESAGSMLQMQGDLVTMFGKLDQVAPTQIEPDVASVKTMLQQEEADTDQIGTNPLGAIASGVITGLQNQTSVQNVNDYIKDNCNLSFMGQSSSQSPSAPSSNSSYTGL